MVKGSSRETSHSGSKSSVRWGEKNFLKLDRRWMRIECYQKPVGGPSGSNAWGHIRHWNDIWDTYPGIFTGRGPGLKGWLLRWKKTALPKRPGLHTQRRNAHVRNFSINEKNITYRWSRKKCLTILWIFSVHIFIRVCFRKPLTVRIVDILIISSHPHSLAFLFPFSRELLRWK